MVDPITVVKVQRVVSSESKQVPAWSEDGIGEINSASTDNVATHGNSITTDLVVTEAPLQIKLEGEPFMVTMRTPGHDIELVYGLLLSEGIIDGVDDVSAIAQLGTATQLDPETEPNTVDVRFSSGVPAKARTWSKRAVTSTSSCGVCGRESIDDLLSNAPLIKPAPDISPLLISQLSALITQNQPVFEKTGGSHGAALVGFDGTIEVVREDIGRHNAVDKVFGYRLEADTLPASGCVLVLSSRVSFEIVQKAVMAGVSVIAAVGAPSSMGVDLAHLAGIKLIGFMKHNQFNVYGGLA